MNKDVANDHLMAISRSRFLTDTFSTSMWFTTPYTLKNKSKKNFEFNECVRMLFVSNYIIHAFQNNQIHTCRTKHNRKQIYC